MNWNKCKLRIMPMLLLAVYCLFGFIDSIQAQHVLVQSEQQQQFVQPDIEYGAWNPVVDLVDYPTESKNNKIRSILSAPPERQSVPKSQFKSRNTNFRKDAVSRRNFETTSPQDQNIDKKPPSTSRPAYKRRPITTSSTTFSPSVTTKIESSAGNRFKNYRKNASDVVTAKPRRPFTPRTTSENVLAIASELPSSTKPSPIKKVPITRGNYRPKPANKEANEEKDDDENYPEHFKQLLKNKEVNTQENDKNVIKKPIKPFRPTSTSEKPTKPVANSSSKPKSNVLFPTRQNRYLPKASVTTTTSTETPLSSSQSVTVAPKRPLRTRSRPTERTRLNIGSTLQEPPTIKQSTPIYATRSPLGQESESYEERIITQADGLKQIDPPISEYIPRTNSIGSSSSALKFSSRFRNSDIASKNGREPSYQATVPTITTTPQLDLNDIDLERWREILPLAAELIHNDGEIMTQSPSQTVSIYEALAEILSKPTESLSFLNNKSTERTLISEAPFSSTTQSSTTSTTTTSTTQKPTTQSSLSTTMAYDDSSSSSKVLNLLHNSTTIVHQDEFDDDKINELIPTISVNNTEETATNVLITTSMPSTIPDSLNITYTTKIIPTTLDTSTELIEKSNTEISFTDDISINDTTTLSATNELNEFSIVHENLINNLTKIETNGKLNDSDIDQIAYSSTNIPSYSIKIVNFTDTPIPSSTTMKSSLESLTKLPKLDLMTRKIGRKYDDSMEFQTSSLFPVYRPNFRSESSTEPMKPLMTSTENLLKTIKMTTQTPKMTLSINLTNFTTKVPNSLKNPSPTKSSQVTPSKFPSKIQNPLNITLNEIIQFNKYLATPNNPNERVVYAILSNNTVVRKVIREPKIVADHHIVYGILPNGTIVRKYRNGTVIRDDTSIEITNIDPKSLISPSSDTFKPKNNTMNLQKPTEMTTTRTKMDNASLIIDLLQKYQNETDTQVKSQNIFSLAKKTHHHELDHSHSDNEVHNISNGQPEVTIKSVSTKISPNHEERPSTQSTIAAGKVSIHPNGIDSSSPTAKSTTVELPKTTGDSFENEILFDENDPSGFKTSSTLPPVYKTTSTVIQSTSRSTTASPRYTSTIRNIPTTSKEFFIESTSQTIPTTTENFVDANVKALQDLLGNSRKSGRLSFDEAPTIDLPLTSSEIPSKSLLSSTASDNFIEKNVKALQELLGGKVTSTELPETTQNLIEKNLNALQELLGKKVTTTDIPVTTQNLIEKNLNTLQELLGRKVTTTELPTTTQNMIEKNLKSLQELLGNTRRVTNTEAPTTTQNFIDKNVKTLEELLGRKVTTTELPKPTENLIEKNLNALQALLGNNNKITSTELPKTTQNLIEKNVKTLRELLERKDTTTELPKTTQNLIENNVKALQELLGSTRKVTTTKSPLTTASTADINLKILQELLANTRKTTKIVTTTTEIPITTTIKLTTQSPRRRVPTQSSTQLTRSTESSILKPTTQSQTTQRTTQTTIQEIISDSTSTSTSVIPKTTHRFTPLQIPNDPPKVLVVTGTKDPKKKAQHSDSDDLEFLRQLAKYIDGGATTKTVTKITIQSTTPIPTTTQSTTQSTTVIIPVTTNTPSTTKMITSRIPTTYSDAEDLAFLKNLREYAGIINLTTQRSVLAQKILELALNRTSKSVDSKQSANNKLESMRPAPFTTTPSPELMMSKIANTQNDINMMSSIIEENKNGKAQTKLSPEEIEKTKKMLQKDLDQYKKDLQLLSLLIGRPLNDRDIAKLASTNLGKPKVKDSFIPLPPSLTTLNLPSVTSSLSTTNTQTSSSTSPIPAFKQLSDNEAKFLQALQQIQTTRSISTTSTTTTTTTTTTPRPIVTESRARSQEALIADLLKQQGIGPGNVNQIPIDKLIEQLSADNRLNRQLAFTPLPTTTIRPFSPMPPLRRQPRPILDGLSWLWRQWQETDPRYQAAPARPQQQQIRPFQSISQPQTSQTSIDDLSFDDEQESSPSNGFANSAPGFLGAAIGVTRAVSRFLGVALTGAGQVLQGAFSGGSSASNPQGFGLFGSSRL